MKISQHILEAVESLQANMTRTSLTILGIVIGVAALIMMLSVGAGAQHTVMRQIETLGANLLMVVPSVQHNANNPRNGFVQPLQLTLRDVATIASNVPEVAVVAPALQGQARIIYSDRNWLTGINGTTAGYFFIREWPLAGGRLFFHREEENASKVAILGATVAKRLFGEADPVGQEVRVRDIPMRIIGVLIKKGQSGSGKDQDDVVFVPYRTALARINADRRKIAPDPVSYILAKASTSELVVRAKLGIDSALRQRHRFPPRVDAGFRVVDPVAQMVAQRRSARTIAWLLAAIASISLVVGGISIMNIMLVSVTERTREIGLRLALGARPRAISRLFLAESSVLCSIGGIIGVAFGIGGTSLIATLLQWPILISPAAVLLALLSSSVVGVVFGYFPARKAAGLLPAAALRAE